MIKKLDACVGDLIEWYDHKRKVVLKSCLGILIYDDGITYVALLYQPYRFFKITYARASIFPRKIK